MPSEKQKKAIQNIVENGGNVSKAMVDAGYSPATAKTPQKLTQSEGFQVLMEQSGLTNDIFVTKLREGLDATDKGEPDFTVRHKYLETGLRLKGLGKSEGGTSITFIGHAEMQRNVYDL